MSVCICIFYNYYYYIYNYYYSLLHFVIEGKPGPRRVSH